MGRIFISGSTIVLLGLTAMVAGQNVVPRTYPAPAAGEATKVNSGLADWAEHDPAMNAQLKREIAEAYRYKGTTVIAQRGLLADKRIVKQVSDLLTKADFIPERRLQRFARLDFDIVVVGWHLTIDQLEVRPNDTVVRVLAAPLLKAPGEGVIGVFSFYREDYRIANGKLQFLGGEPLPENLSINFAIQ